MNHTERCNAQVFASMLQGAAEWLQYLIKERISCETGTPEDKEVRGRCAEDVMTCLEIIYRQLRAMCMPPNSWPMIASILEEQGAHTASELIHIPTRRIIQEIYR